MIFDAHSDYGIQIYRQHLRGFVSDLIDTHFEVMRKSNVKIEVLTVGGDFELDGINYSNTNVSLDLINCIRSQIVNSNNRFVLIQNSCDLENVEKTDSIGLIFALEGASPLGKDFEHLDLFYEQGVRSLILTCNASNGFSGGCIDPSIGLRKIGKELIKKLNEYQIVIDLSHISEKAFFEVFDYTDKAPIVSHANVKAISNHFRNLSDNQIQFISSRGGIIGLSLISLFIDCKVDCRTSISKFLDHINHIKHIAGIDNIGIGADFMDYIEDMVLPVFDKLQYPRTMSTYPEGVNSVYDIGYVLTTMKNNGFINNEIELFSYGNFAGLFKRELKHNK